MLSHSGSGQSALALWGRVLEVIREAGPVSVAPRGAPRLEPEHGTTSKALVGKEMPRLSGARNLIHNRKICRCGFATI
jgi:hypothetical protein